jgi:hypothetical protein
MYAIVATNDRLHWDREKYSAGGNHRRPLTFLIPIYHDVIDHDLTPPAVIGTISLALQRSGLRLASRRGERHFQRLWLQTFRLRNTNQIPKTNLDRTLLRQILITSKT